MRDDAAGEGSALSEGLGPLPEPVAWFRAPYGTLEPNPLFRVTGPQSLEWAVACFTEDQLRAAVASAVAAETELLRRALHALVWETGSEGLFAAQTAEVLKALRARLGA